MPRTGGGRPRSRFRDVALASGLVDADQVSACEAAVADTLEPAVLRDPVRRDTAVADCLVSRGDLTRFQADQLLKGKKKLTLGQYRILEELGRGGMGQVFLARHDMLDRVVAVKVLPRDKTTRQSEAAFRREIRLLARLDHEHLVRALDAGHDGKVYYLVTEFVPGLDLRRQVVIHGRLDEVRAVSVIAQAASGLAYAHSQGLVHRDVKPANILVTAEGHVKVLDLGLAGSSLETESLYLGRRVGTIDYMAPEQIRSPEDVGPLADIYALGCSFYFTLVGETPFPGGTRQERAQRHLKEQPRPLRQLRPDVSEGVCRVVEAMMQKSPRQRPASAEAVIDLLRSWTPAEPLAMPRGRTGRPSRDRGGSSVVGGRSPPSPSATQASMPVFDDVLSVGESGSPRPLWPMADDTEGEGGPLPPSTAELVRGAAAALRGWISAAGRSVGLAAVLALAVVGLLALVVGTGEAAATWFGQGVRWFVGCAAFGLVLAVRLIVALGRTRR